MDPVPDVYLISAGYVVFLLISISRQGALSVCMCVWSPIVGHGSRTATHWKHVGVPVTGMMPMYYLGMYMSVCANTRELQARVVARRKGNLSATYRSGPKSGLNNFETKGLRIGYWSSCRSKPATAETKGMSWLQVTSMPLDQLPNICVFMCIKVCTWKGTGKQ